MTFLKDHKFLVLMLSILGLFVFYPFIIVFATFSFIINIFFSLILLACVFALSGRGVQYYTSVTLAVPYLLSIWLAQQFQHHPLLLLSYLIGICYFLYVIITILLNILQQSQIYLETIFGAVSAYLLIGLAWSLIYSCIEIFQPGSFSFPDIDTQDQRLAFIYLSFITLTTLGYGDITPLTSVAQAWRILEATV